jgi:aspartokinase/homoserine dehydrogenase 1
VLGGVGCAFIEQIHRQQTWLKHKNINLRVCAIANSQNLLMNINGINLENWREQLTVTQQQFYPGPGYATNKRISFAQSGGR